LLAGNVYALTLSGKSQQIFKPSKEVFVTRQHVNARYNIKHIDFRGTGNQSGRVIVDVSSTSIPIDVTQTGKEVIVVFNSTRVPSGLMKRYDVMDFQSPAQLLTVVQDGRNARLTINNKGDYGHFAYQVNKQFIIDVFPLSKEEIKQAKLKKKIYTGKLISLNFQNIQIRIKL
jgi:type IV pilus assembly protein PilQ